MELQVLALECLMICFFSISITERLMIRLQRNSLIGFPPICDSSQVPLVYDEKKKRLTLAPEFYQKNQDTHIELYIGKATNRYATFTGNVMVDLPLTDGTEAVLMTLDKNMRKKPKRAISTDPDDGEIFDIIASLRKQKNGEKFKLLHDKGDRQACGFGSQSEADASLCALIAFRTGDDPEMIDAIFKTSALYRDKWDRDDYSSSTIAAGIEACRGVFHKSKMDRPEVIRFHENGNPYVSVPLLAKYVREHLDYVLVRDNGKQAVLKYVYENGYYRLYADNMIMGIIKQYISEYDEELVRMSVLNETMQLINTDLNYIRQ